MWCTHKSELVELISEGYCEILAEHCWTREVAGAVQAFGPSGYPLLMVHPAIRAAVEGLASDEV